MKVCVDSTDLVWQLGGSGPKLLSCCPSVLNTWLLSHCLGRLFCAWHPGCFPASGVRDDNSLKSALPSVSQGLRAGSPAHHINLRAAVQDWVTFMHPVRWEVVEKYLGKNIKKPLTTLTPTAFSRKQELNLPCEVIPPSTRIEIMLITQVREFKAKKAG